MQAIAQLEPAPAQPTTPSQSDERAFVATPTIIAALRDLDSLLEASNMDALQRFAQIRPQLDANQKFCEDLEAALHNLDLEQAHRLCSSVLERVNTVADK